MYTLLLFHHLLLIYIACHTLGCSLKLKFIYIVDLTDYGNFSLFPTVKRECANVYKAREHPFETMDFLIKLDIMS